MSNVRPHRRKRDILSLLFRCKNQDKEHKPTILHSTSSNAQNINLSEEHQAKIPSLTSGQSGSVEDSKKSGQDVKHVDQTLWALAFQELHKANPELIKTFTSRLGVDTEIGDKWITGDLAQKAISKIEETKDSKLVDGKSAKVRRHFEQIIKILVASKDFISAATAANPYAATVWTGVCFILPVSSHARQIPLYY